MVHTSPGLWVGSASLLAASSLLKCHGLHSLLPPRFWFLSRRSNSPPRDTANVPTRRPTALTDAWLHGGFLNEPVPEGTRVILQLRARVQPDPGLYGTEEPCLAVIAIFGLFSAKATAAHPVSRCKVRMNDDDRSCQAVRCCSWESSLSCIPSCPLCEMEYSISNPLN